MEEERGSVSRPVLTTINDTPSSSPIPASVKQTPLSKTRRTTSPSPWNSDEYELVEEAKPRFATSMLDAYSIGDAMASRLVACLLGFVLFLKSQIPVPVTQLVKTRSGESSDKHNKLLTSFDALSQNLGSTFTTLAVAFAQTTDASRASHNPDLAKSHLAIVLGPSPTSLNAARARVILELDGVRVAPSISVSETGNDMIEVADDTGTYRRSGLSSGPAPMNGASEADSEDYMEDLCGSIDAEGRSHSDTESELEDSETYSEERDITDDDESSFFKETEADLSAAERNLARVLAIANSDPEMGLASDIRPTYTHVLLRAPRMFSHPSWIPRQSLARDLDPLLHGFSEPAEAERPCAETSEDILNDANGLYLHPGARDSLKAARTHKAVGTVKTDYVRVQSRGAAAGDPFDVVESLEGDNDEGDGSEMIWWSWDGRLEGFTEI